MVSNVWVCGRWEDNPPPIDTSLMIADPVYGAKMVREIVEMGLQMGFPSLVFMWPSDLIGLPVVPDQILHWVKPVSTKNTSKNYSRFVEVIACYDVQFHGNLHWSNRTGIFTDNLFSNDEHPWKKPEPLIERLIRNHYPGEGIVYDPCAGSGTVHDVCKRLGIPSFSVEVAANVER